MTGELPDLGRVGVWTPGLDLVGSARARDAVAELEDVGYGAVWLSEGLVREPLVHAADLLAATTRIVVGTAVTVVYGRHPRVVRAQRRALADAHPERFVLGLGTSHARYVEGALGLEYRRPLAHLRRFLDDLDRPDPLLELVGIAADGQPPTPRLLAALGPAAMDLARDRAAGAVTYLTTPEHTAWARGVLGPDATLVVEQAVVTVASNDDGVARARAHLAGYLPARPYRATWERLGFGADDLAGDGSERLARALVAVGDEDVAERVAAHLAAGADHVCLQALGDAVPTDQWRHLAPLAREVGAVTPAR